MESALLKWSMGERDIQLLEALCNKEPQLVANQFGISVDALNSWVARIRGRKERYRWWLNRVLGIEKRCPHVRRRLLPTRRKQQKEEEW